MWEIVIRSDAAVYETIYKPNVRHVYAILPIEDWGRISVGLSEHLYAPEIVSRLNQPGVCLNSQVMTMDIGSEAA